MPALPRFLFGLVAALIAGWIAHGPLGQGEAFVARLQADSEQVLSEAALTGVAVRFPSDPLRREAVLSGTANDFQKEGMGLLPGINDRIRAVPGVAGVRWDETDCCAPEE